MEDTTHLYGYLYQPTYESYTLPSLQLNLEGGQLFCLTEGKGPHEWPCYCHHNLFYLVIVAVMMLINPCRNLDDVLVDINQD